MPGCGLGFCFISFEYRTHSDPVIPAGLCPAIFSMPDDFRVWTSSWYDWHTWHRSDVVGLIIRHTFPRANLFWFVVLRRNLISFPKVGAVVLIYSAVTSSLSDQWKAK